MEAVRAAINTNLIGALATAHAAAPRLLAHGGSVLMIASSVGLSASPRLVGYGASKAAVIQLTRTLAREWADRGVRVNTLCPGYVETDLTRELLVVDHLRARILADTPQGRLGTLEEIVQPALFLLSDAASYITGAVLTADGGMST